MLGIALDRHDVDGLGLMGVYLNRKAKVRRQIATYFGPGVARIIGAHNIPVLLHKQGVRVRGVQSDSMNAVSNFSLGIRQLPRGFQPLVYRFPGLAAVVSSENSGGRDSDEHT